jgi:hypothetical protein
MRTLTHKNKDLPFNLLWAKVHEAKHARSSAPHRKLLATFLCCAQRAGRGCACVRARVGVGRVGVGRQARQVALGLDWRGLCEKTKKKERERERERERKKSPTTKNAWVGIPTTVFCAAQ